MDIAKKLRELEANNTLLQDTRTVDLSNTTFRKIYGNGIGFRIEWGDPDAQLYIDTEGSGRPEEGKGHFIRANSGLIYRMPFYGVHVMPPAGKTNNVKIIFVPPLPDCIASLSLQALGNEPGPQPPDYAVIAGSGNNTAITCPTDQCIEVTGFSLQNLSAVATAVILKEGTSGTERYKFILSPELTSTKNDGGGAARSGIAWRLPWNTDLVVNLDGANNIGSTFEYRLWG